MTTTTKFEARFQGKTNAGIRSMILGLVDSYSAEMRGLAPAGAQSLPARILALGDSVALTAAGRATLKLVAADYDRPGTSEAVRDQRTTTTEREP